MNSRPLQYLYIGAWSIIFILIGYLAVVGNLPFINKPFALHVDQAHDITNILAILKIDSFQSFKQIFFHTAPGGDYHGFLTFYIPAIISCIPYKIWGMSGLILTYRLSSVIFVSLGYFLVSVTFQKKSWKRLLLFITLLLLPFTNLFFYWPRCESYQIFFLSLFLFFYYKRQNSLRSFIFLGLSLISRISLLPYVLAFLVYECFVRFKLYQVKVAMKSILGRIGLIILGFLLGQPSNLFKFTQWLNGKIHQMYTDTGIDQSFDYSMWQKTVIPYYTWHTLIYHLIALLIALISIGLIYKNLKSLLVKNFYDHQDSIIGILGLSAVVTNTTIMNGIKITHSQWYLMLNFVLIFVLLFKYLEIFKIKELFHNIILSFFCLYLILFRVEGFSPFYKPTGYEFTIKKNREKSYEHLSKMKVYELLKTSLNNFLQNHLTNKDRKLKVRLVGHIYRIPESDQFEIEHYWGPAPMFDVDKNKIDIVYFDKRKHSNHLVLKNMPSGEIEMRKKGAEDFNRLVSSTNGGQCNKNCFIEFPINDRYSFFIKENLIKHER